MHVIFLPPYYSNLNPIEQAFSVIKLHLRRVGDIAWQGWPLSRKDDSNIYIHLYDLVYTIGKDNAYGFYHRSGYV